MSWRSLAGLAALLVVLAGWTGPVGAQEGELDETRDVNVALAIGDYDDDRSDWSVDAVVVTGDLEEGKDFTVQLLGAGGQVVWEATRPFTSPEVLIQVNEPTYLSDVSTTRISQALTIVDALLVEPDINSPVSGGGGGAGQIATTMVLVIIIALILFRTPLPSAASQRWTK